MLKKHEQHRIHDLLEAGFSVAEVARMTGKSLGTIYKYKRLGRQMQGWGGVNKDKKIPEELVPFKATLDMYAARRKIKPTEVFFLVQEQGYRGSRYQFDRYMERRRQELQPNKQLKHVESAPGEQAQVDWGHFGELTINGKREKVYLFSYVLSWSRAAYMEFVVRQNQRTLQICHINAFEKLGIPETIVYDNMKTVVIGREKMPDGTKKVRYNIKFLDFARYYQFEPIACPPYWPRAKGKVESSIKYARHFFSRCTPSVNITLEKLNENLAHWLDETAQQRTHGSTGEKPQVRWEREKSLLRFPDKLPIYDATPIRAHHTTQYGILCHNGATYHLGKAHALVKIEVRDIQNHGLPLLEIYRNNTLIATVPVPANDPKWVTVFEDAPTSRATKKQKITKDKIKQPKSYDIDVAMRNLDYYSIPVNTTQGGAI